MRNNIKALRTYSEQEVKDAYPSLAHLGKGEIFTIVRERYPSQPFMSKGSQVCERMRSTLEGRGTSTKKSDVTLTYRTHVNAVGNVLTYHRNDGYGGSEPDDLLAQRAKFKRQLYAVHPVVLASFERCPRDGVPAPDNGYTPPPLPSLPACIKCGVTGEAHKFRAGECEACYSPPIKVKVDPPRDFYRWSIHAREVCERRNADGHPLDEWGMRPTIDGLALIAAGCPVDAVKDACVMHWPEDARREVKAAEYDFTRYGIARYLDAAATARVPDGDNARPVCLMMVGGKGTGKSTHARALASRMFPGEVGRFGSQSVTAGTSPSAFYGRPRAGGDGEVVESLFVKIYRNGGVYLFDEVDAGDPNILLIVNAALANSHFPNQATGEEVPRHPAFVPVAAANTLGLGASRDYTGRERIDAATLDRFAAGRIRVKIDTDLERSIAANIIGCDAATL